MVAQLVKNPQCRRPWFDSWVGKIPWRKDRLPTPIFLGFPGSSDAKESSCNVGHLSSIHGLGRSHGGGHDNPLQYSCLENPHRQRSLVGYSPWGCKELDTTEWLKHNYTLIKLKVLAQAVVVFKWGTHFMLCFFFLVFEYFSNFS